MADDASGRPDPSRTDGMVGAWRRQQADPTGAAERARQWAEENAEAIAAYNARVEREGVFGEEWPEG